MQQRSSSRHITYHPEVTATGPYPGTFVEDITIGAAFRPLSLPESAPTMKSFHATFTITSGSTIVTGTKELPVFAPGFAWCTGTSQPVFYGFFETTALTYSATIEADGRTYADSGSAKARDATFDGNRAASCKAFTEEFITSNGVASREPRTTEECKNGGWKIFPQNFKNEGKCKQYVDAR